MIVIGALHFAQMRTPESGYTVLLPGVPFLPWPLYFMLTPAARARTQFQSCWSMMRRSGNSRRWTSLSDRDLGTRRPESGSRTQRRLRQTQRPTYASFARMSRIELATQPLRRCCVLLRGGGTVPAA